MTMRSGTAAVVTAAILAATSLTSSTFAAESRPRRGFGPQGPQVSSPEVSSDRRVTFRVLAPKAQSVRLSGSDIPGVGQGVAMKQGTGGVWEVTLDPIEPGAYRYRFDVDGVPVMDPRNPSTSESNSNAWSLVYVPGSDFMDTKDVPHGAVAEVTYYSKSLKRFRRMHVYTPPGYESNADRYPVFYLLHGAFDCDDSWTSVGRAGFILDNLIAAKKATPMVVVMPAGHTGPFGFGPRGRGSRPVVDEFTQDFLGDVMPYVESHYRVYTDRQHRAIAGLSMGGSQTLNIAIPHLDKFAYFGVFSSGVFGITGGARGGAPGASFGPTWEEQHRDALDNAALKKGLKLVWFATGKDDFLLETSRGTVNVLKKHGFDVVLKETSGGHTWINGRQYLNEFARLLFQETASAAPPAGFDVLREGIPRGRVATVEYQSKSIGTTRKMVVYTPPGYTQQRKYPVLYLLHGIGDDEEGWRQKGSADVILDNLYADRKLEPMIVVMPNGRASRDVTIRTPWNEQFPAFEAFEKDLLQDVIPFVEAHYPVKNDRAHRALAGLSMGGGQSLNFGLGHLDVFAWVGGFSSAPNTKAASALIPDPARASKELKLLWVSCGDQDGLMRISERFHSALEEMKVPHTWHVGSGGHTWPVWKRDLYLFSQRLFR
jgi:enterochelin esterase-like enzyme